VFVSQGRAPQSVVSISEKAGEQYFYITKKIDVQRRSTSRRRGGHLVLFPERPENNIIYIANNFYVHRRSTRRRRGGFLCHFYFRNDRRTILLETPGVTKATSLTKY
jgi:hypothetical protein